MFLSLQLLDLDSLIILEQSASSLKNDFRPGRHKLFDLM